MQRLKVFARVATSPICCIHLTSLGIVIIDDRAAKG